MTEIDPDKTTFCDTSNMDYFSSSYTPFKHPMTLFKTRNKKVGQVYTQNFSITTVRTFSAFVKPRAFRHFSALYFMFSLSSSDMGTSVVPYL